MLDALAGGWQLAGINTVTPGEPVTLTYTPGATFVVSGIQQDFRGANNYRPNVTCDPYARQRQQSITNWFNKDCVVVPTDPSQPFGNAPRNSVRGPNFWTFDLAAIKQVALGRSGAKFELRLEAFNLFNRDELRAAQRQPQLRRRSARSPPPTIRASSSSASSCCGDALRHPGGWRGAGRGALDRQRRPRS